MKKKDFKDLLISIDQVRKIHCGKLKKSKCCNAPVTVEGLPDFPGDKYPCTVHYVCTKCKKACDIKAREKRNKMNILIYKLRKNYRMFGFDYYGVAKTLEISLWFYNVIIMWGNEEELNENR